MRLDGSHFPGLSIDPEITRLFHLRNNLGIPFRDGVLHCLPVSRIGSRWTCPTALLRFSNATRYHVFPHAFRQPYLTSRPIAGREGFGCNRIMQRQGHTLTHRITAQGCPTLCAVGLARPSLCVRVRSPEGKEKGGICIIFILSS